MKSPDRTRSPILCRSPQVLRGLCLLFCTLWLTNCAHKTSQEKMQDVRESAHVRPAATMMEGFWLDYRSPPDKPAEHWEFYYKHCSLISRKPYMDEAEYRCTAPY